MDKEVKKIFIKILKKSGPVLVEVGAGFFANLVRYGADKIGSITFDKDKDEVIIEPFGEVIDIDKYKFCKKDDINKNMNVIEAMNKFNKKFINKEPNKIKHFRGDNFFLSSYYVSKIIYKGISYTTAEAAFQSMKTKNIEERKKFSDLRPKEAKEFGRRITLREDWEEVKEEVMYNICLCKFNQNEYLADRLRKTGNAYLQQESSWNDKEWGTVNDEGENKLGKILMRVRDEINRDI